MTVRTCPVTFSHKFSTNTWSFFHSFGPTRRVQLCVHSYSCVYTTVYTAVLSSFIMLPWRAAGIQLRGRAGSDPLFGGSSPRGRGRCRPTWGQNHVARWATFFSGALTCLVPGMACRRCTQQLLRSRNRQILEFGIQIVFEGCVI